MLQKIVNGIAIASGVVSLTVVGAVGVVYLNKDAIIEKVKTEALNSIGGGALGGLGGAVGGGALDLPTTPATPAEPDAGLGIPSF
tara:strand:+ start:275 stop:529 length:255 start_codon:yes stop_codon:yes gene_type:complete